MEFLAERVTGSFARDPQLGARLHQLVIGLDNHEAGQVPLQASAS